MLTHDNPLLSRPTIRPKLSPNSGQPTVSDAVRGYVAESLSENTRRAYRSDLTHFMDWGGSVPCSAELLAEYVADQAEHLTPATIARRLASISKAHAARSAQNPTEAQIVRSTLRGVRRSKSTKQRQAKPLLKEDLFAVLACMGDDIKAVRDTAILLLGFAGAFRRSELVDLNCSKITGSRHGLIVTIAKSKTDQDGRGRQIGVPFGRTKWCPVSALNHWLETAKILEGPVFRSVNRHGTIARARLGCGSVSSILQSRLTAAGYDHTLYSAHSLRSGLATSAAAAGVSSWKIRQQTGHASDATLSRYIRDGQLFKNNAAGIL